MTRKDYVLIAAALNNVRLRLVDSDYTLAFNAGIEATANELCSTLALDNPRFDTERFLKACGVAS